MELRRSPSPSPAAANVSGSSTVTWTVMGSDCRVPAAADADDFAGIGFATFATGTVTFAAYETEKIITVDVVADSVFEADEGFKVMLSDAVVPPLIGQGKR